MKHKVFSQRRIREKVFFNFGIFFGHLSDAKMRIVTHIIAQFFNQF
jgi:hypothetical protein